MMRCSIDLHTCVCLQACVCIQAYARRRYSALYIACQEAHAEVATLLLDRGASIHLASDRGYSPLFSVCQAGHVQMARLLLGRGADVEQAMRGGATPLRVPRLNRAHAGYVDLFVSDSIVHSSTPRVCDRLDFKP